MNRIKKPILLLSILCLSMSLTSCKKDKGSEDQPTDKPSTEVASEESNDSILRPSGTIKPNASTISLFIKTYNDNKDKDMENPSENTQNMDTSSETGGTDNTNQEATGTNISPSDSTTNEDTNTKADTNTTSDTNTAESNNTNVNPGGIVPETTDQSSIDLPYGGNPQAVKEKAAADAKEEEGKFELRSQEKLKEGKDEKKK